MWYMHEGAGWWMAFGGVWMVIFWAVIIGLVIWAVRKFTARDGGSTRRQDPLDIAKERYARGEITREEFEQIKKDL